MQKNNINKKYKKLYITYSKKSMGSIKNIKKNQKLKNKKYKMH